MIETANFEVYMIELSYILIFSLIYLYIIFLSLFYWVDPLKFNVDHY